VTGLSLGVTSLGLGVTGLGLGVTGLGLGVTGLGLGVTGLGLEKNRWSWFCNLVILLHHCPAFMRTTAKLFH